MTHESGDRPEALALIAGILGDVGQLVHKEAQLAVAELRRNAAATLGAFAWLGLAALFGFTALLVAAAAAALFVASAGIPLAWSCLIVAGGALALALVFALVGRARIGFTPKRTLSQFWKDAALMKDERR